MTRNCGNGRKREGVTASRLKNAMTMATVLMVSVDACQEPMEMFAEVYKILKRHCFASPFCILVFLDQLLWLEEGFAPHEGHVWAYSPEQGFHGPVCDDVDSDAVRYFVLRV